MFSKNKFFLAFEFLIICVLIPTLIIINVWAPYMFAFLWSVCGYAFLIYRYTDFTSYSELWNWSAVNKSNLKPIFLRWALASIGMLVFILWYDPERAFFLPLNAPEVIPFLVLGYPVISALPQEFIFCTYFFSRFKPFFGSGKLMITVSAIVFAYAHILYINPVAPILSLCGGLIFAHTYAKTKSLGLITLEHSLYGITLFMTGLGWYFYSGGVISG